MNRKISLGLALSLIIITAAASFAITMTFSQKIYNKLLPELSKRTEMRAAIDEIDGIVRAKYFGEIDNSSSDMNAALAEGYIKGLDDKLCKYFPAGEYTEYKDRLEGKIHGIGISQVLNQATGFIQITDVSPGSSAATAGLQKGDEIISIDGTKVNSDNYALTVKKLEGMSLSTVDLIYRRDGTDGKINVMIGYDAQSVFYEVVQTDTGQNVGYIRIISFYKTTPQQLKKALAEIDAEKLTGIIFDVRNTGEGTIEYAADVLDILAPSATEGTATLATLKDKDGNTLEDGTFSSDAKDITTPMAVLTNSNTAGCAKLFACDLRDFKKAALVGNTTDTDSTAQELIPLKDGGGILLTVAKVQPYLTAQEDYDKGVAPDNGYEVSLTSDQAANPALPSMNEDTQFHKAMELF